MKKPTKNTKRQQPQLATNIFADRAAQAVKQQLIGTPFGFTPNEADELLGKWYDKAIAELKQKTHKLRYFPTPLTIAKRILRLEIRGGATPSGLFDRRWVDAINQVLEDREVNITITDILPALWDEYIGPMVDAIEESVKNISEEEALVTLEALSCAKCGTVVAQSKVIVDEGEGEEAGNIFYYCSTNCRDHH